MQVCNNAVSISMNIFIDYIQKTTCKNPALKYYPQWETKVEEIHKIFPNPFEFVFKEMKISK